MTISRLFPTTLLLATVFAGPVMHAETHRQEDTTSNIDPFAPIDPQKWVNPDNMTWEQFVPVPGVKWSDPNRKGSVRNFKIALVTVDYPDQPFVVTRPPRSDIFQNPQPSKGNNLPREQVPKFYADFLNTPNDINHFHTLHEYWMEDSGGRYGVDLTPFGPFRMPKKSFQYGLDNSKNPGACPEQPCNLEIRTDALSMWKKMIGEGEAKKYELVFVLAAGQDESSTWQEFGPMKFLRKEDIPKEWGPPAGSNVPNYAKSRYTDWTSWAAASAIWPNAVPGSSTQAESSGAGTFAHELSHLLGIADNYNNPYGKPVRRAFTGPFSMLDRGSFNGPGGPHTRWVIPPTAGGSMGSLHTMRDKLQIGLVDKANVLMTSRTELAANGPIVATLTARAVDPRTRDGGKGLMGIRITMDKDNRPQCDFNTDYMCDGGGFNHYEMEVVDRMGQDSFQPDSGVFISKTKVNDKTAPFQWAIDANPQDINVVDYIGPDKMPHKMLLADYRQLMDALFHAGTRSGSKFEHIDEPNRLHLYILERNRVDGVLQYRVGARSLDGNGGKHTYGLQLSEGKPAGAASGAGTLCTFDLSNTGKAAGNDPRFHSDIVRLSAKADQNGWKVETPNALAAVEFGKSTKVTVAVAGSGSGTVTLTAKSEGDGKTMATAKCKLG